MGWDWSEPQHHLSMTDMVKLASISLSSDQQCWDEAGWMTRDSTIFSVKSASKIANKWASKSPWEGWRVIWRMKIHQRVKVFIWILAYESL